MGAPGLRLGEGCLNLALSFSWAPPPPGLAQAKAETKALLWAQVTRHPHAPVLKAQAVFLRHTPRPGCEPWRVPCLHSVHACAYHGYDLRHPSVPGLTWNDPSSTCLWRAWCRRASSVHTCPHVNNMQHPPTCLNRGSCSRTRLQHATNVNTRAASVCTGSTRQCSIIMTATRNIHEC